MDYEIRMLFPEGKRKALTFSYDDGTIHDRRLAALLNEYGMKGTFNLNYGLLGKGGMETVNGIETDFSRVEAEEVRCLYQGHEIASHAYSHASLTGLPKNMAATEVLKDRYNLEQLTGELIRGFAYPYGAYNSQIEEILDACGIEYARTVESTGDFCLPEDFLAWHPTCHHEDERLMALAEKFCREEKDGPFVFYLWGHSYEFEQKNNWELMENFLKYMAQYKEDIWCATNIEILDYVKAYRELKRSTDGKILMNPNATPLYVAMNGRKYCIHGNEKLELPS